MGSSTESLLELLNEIDVKKEGLKEITEALLNWIMQKEREYFLQRDLTIPMCATRHN